MERPKDYYDKYLMPAFQFVMVGSIFVSMCLLIVAMLAGIKALLLYLF